MLLSVRTVHTYCLSSFFLLSSPSFVLLTRPSSDLHASPPITAGVEEAKSQTAAAALSATERERQTQAVSMETSGPGCRRASHIPSHTPPPSVSSSETEAAAKDVSRAAATAGGLEDDKDRIVVEIMQMYRRQQEKLNSTLHKQLQLEMVSGWVEKMNDHKINQTITVLDVNVEVTLTFH